MTTARSIVLLAALVLYSTHIATDSASASECVNLLRRCEMSGNVPTNDTMAGQNGTFRNINSTLKAIKEATMDKECLLPIRKLLCISAIRACNSNNTTLSQLPCKMIKENCTGFVRRTYAGDLCPQIDSYNSSECVKVTLARTGYCPHNDTYKIAAGNIKEFLKKASVEKEKNQTAQTRNISDECLAEYKRIKCATFVLTCAINITKESCEQKLQCLPTDTFVNKTRLCSNFSSRIPTTVSTTTTQEVTTPYDLRKGFNTTVTIRLNTQFNSMYSNKSSTLYKSFASNVKDGLKVVYQEISGFRAVVVVELTCEKEVAVKHIVVTSSAPNVKVMEALLILANISTGGYLEGKVMEANKMCVDTDNHDDSDDHTDSTNWVYMIVFVCITALLLLAMVCECANAHGLFIANIVQHTVGPTMLRDVGQKV